MTDHPRAVDTRLEEECADCPGRLDRLVRLGRIVAGLVSLAAAAWWTARALAAWWSSAPEDGPGLEIYWRSPATLPDAETFGELRTDPLTLDETIAADGRHRALDSGIRL